MSRAGRTFPERDDLNYLKATIAMYDPATHAANVSYDKVDTSLLPPRARTYGKKEVSIKPAPAAAPQAAAATAAAAS